MAVSVTFDRDSALEWLRGKAGGMATSRYEEYGDAWEISDQPGKYVEGVDETQLETVVGEYQDNGPGFGPMRVGAWVDDLLLCDEPGIHVTVEIDVPRPEPVCHWCVQPIAQDGVVWQTTDGQPGCWANPANGGDAARHEPVLTWPLRLAGGWQGMRQWVDTEACAPGDGDHLAVKLANYLEKVAAEANAALIIARSAVQAGVLS